jgi:serine protease AprX
MTSRSRVVTLIASGLLFTALAATTVYPQDQHSKLDSVLQAAQRRGGAVRLKVILQIQAGRRAPIRQQLEAGGFAIRAEHPLINAISIEVPANALSGLAQQPDVLSISLDATLQGSAAPTTASNSSVLRQTLGLTSTSPRGGGTGVAVFDSGIYPSPDFGNRITAFYDFTRGGVASAPYDDYGHGTHAAGLIAGTGLLSNGVFQGVAPSVNLIGVKVLDSSGVGSVSTVISALEYATTNKSELGIDVINLSLGHPIFEPATTDPLVAAVERAVRAGIVVVVAAGNYGIDPTTGLSGYGGIASPGNAPSAITVGSMNPRKTVVRTDDRVDPFSSRGPSWFDGFAKPDVVAPGRSLIAPAAPGSTLAINHPELLVGDASGSLSYITLSGTSMAAAVTSGIAAVVIAANRAAVPTPHPALPPNAVKAILEYTGVRVTDASGVLYNRLVQGAGAVNAGGAIELAAAIDTSASTGTWWLTRGVQTQTRIGNETSGWSQEFIWNNTPGYGSSIYIN